MKCFFSIYWKYDDEINLEQNSQKLNTWKLCNKLQTNYNLKVWNKFNSGSYNPVYKTVKSRSSEYVHK